MIELPACVNQELWAAFCESRKAMGRQAPFTERAQRMWIEDLVDWHLDGYDTDFILREAVKKGWRGLFVNDRTPKLAKKRELPNEQMTYARVWARLKEQREDALFRKDGVWAAGCVLAMRSLNDRKVA